MNHLPLETCRQLKEAGFPQDEAGYWYHWLEYRNEAVLLRSAYSEDRHWQGAHRIACPNSDELLEALPPGYTTSGIGNKWITWYPTSHRHGNPYMPPEVAKEEEDREFRLSRTSGSHETPAHALAALYLALNAKQ